MWHDLRQAVRALTKHPGFAALAALVLGLGIGLNTAIFSVVRAMLFTPPPVHEPHRLVSIYQVFAGHDRPIVIHRRQYEYLRDHNETFASLTAHWRVSYSLRADNETSAVNAAWVLSNYFDVLGVKPLLGRPLQAAEDDVANPARGVVISHALWTQRFRSAPDIVGREIELALWGRMFRVYTIVGVMDAGFKGLADPWQPMHVWVTMAQGQESHGTSWSGAMVARLKEGATIEQARAIVSTQGRTHYYSNPAARPEYEPRLVAYPTSEVRTPFDPSAAYIPRRLAGALTIVVALVLLVAAANIAGILMARGVGRAGEIAVRRVLGAGPLRIVRQLLAESVVLALAGGAFGLLLASGLVQLFHVFTPVQFAFDVAMDGYVVLFTMVICLAAGAMIGILPARQAGSLDVLPWLSAGGGGQTTHARGGGRRAITIPQAAFSLVLLLTAGVYVRALLDIEFADLGYQPRNLLVARTTLQMEPQYAAVMGRPTQAAAALAEQHAARTRRFYTQLLERARAIPGTTDVALASALPLREPPERPDWSAVAHEAYLAGERSGAGTERASVSPGYFATMGMAVVAGRDFDNRDTRTTPKVAIVSRKLAQRLWPGRDATGRTMTLVSSWNVGDKPDSYEIVGVVGEVSPILHERETRPFVYLPLSQEWRPSSAHVLVRGEGDSRELMPAIKAAVRGADAFADTYRVETMAQMVGEIMYPRRIAGAVLAVSGLLALCLAAVGIYGVVSYAVARRTGEIGIRMALGADRRDIIRLILREGGVIAGWGSAAGLVLGYAAIKLTSSNYLALPRVDLLTVLLTPMVLAAVILAACYVPARRAGLLNPIQALRRG